MTRIRRLSSLWSSVIKRGRSRSRRGRRLTLEALEDRFLPSYTYVDLGPVDGGPNCVALAISKVQTDGSVQMLGWSWNPSTPSPVYWSYKGGTTTSSNLPSLAGSQYPQGSAVAVNNNNVYVGNSASSVNNPTIAHGTSWSSPYSSAGDLGVLATGDSSSAYGLNSNGSLWIVGSDQSSSYSDAVVWKNGGIQDINDGSQSSVAYGVNDSDTIVGQAQLTIGAPKHAVYWDSSLNIHDMGSLIGSSGSSSALAINGSGTIVGWSTATGGIQHAMSYANGTMTDISVGGVFTGALAINSSGVIVGRGNSESRAYIYSGGTATDLNTLTTPPSGYTLNAATGINDSGYICGYSGFQSHGGPQSEHAFLLIPNVSGPSLARSASAFASISAPAPSNLGKLTASFSPLGFNSALAGASASDNSLSVPQPSAGSSVWGSSMLTAMTAQFGTLIGTPATEMSQPAAGLNQAGDSPPDIDQLATIEDTIRQLPF